MHKHNNYDNCVVSLDNGIQYIRDTVGDQFSKDDMIDAIKYCNMDAAAAISHLHEKGELLFTSMHIVSYFLV